MRTAYWLPEYDLNDLYQGIVCFVVDLQLPTSTALARSIQSGVPYAARWLDLQFHDCPWPTVKFDL